MTPARPASTVLVLRPGAGGPEVLLVRRARSMGFFPDAWVFPGGRVDPSDATVPVRGADQGHNLEHRDAIVASARECFEEAGIWLGPTPLGAQVRHDLNQGRSSLAHVADAVVDLQLFRLWSRWVTPEQEPKRYDTRFFLARLPQHEDLEASPDGQETTALTWLLPAEALHRHRAGQLPLAPPTFRTLEELSDHSTLDALWQEAERRTAPTVAPHLRLDLPESEGPAIILPGDVLHPDPRATGPVTRLILRQGHWLSLSRPRTQPAEDRA